jgi:hypothetical protein
MAKYKCYYWSPTGEKACMKHLESCVIPSYYKQYDCGICETLEIENFTKVLFYLNPIEIYWLPSYLLYTNELVDELSKGMNI